MQKKEKRSTTIFAFFLENKSGLEQVWKRLGTFFEFEIKNHLKRKFRHFYAKPFYINPVLNLSLNKSTNDDQLFETEAPKIE